VLISPVTDSSPFFGFPPTAARRSELFDPPHSQTPLVLAIGDVVDFDRRLDRARLIGRIDITNPQGRASREGELRATETTLSEQDLYALTRRVGSISTR
jgi:hypothetical protein